MRLLQLEHSAEILYYRIPSVPKNTEIESVAPLAAAGFSLR